MAYRIHAKFKDGTTNGRLTDIVAAEPPHYGDTIHIRRQGHDVPMLVIAIWTPSANKFSHGTGNAADALIVVEAREA